VKRFRANSVSQGKRKLFKILKDKKYIEYSEFRAHSVFQGMQKLNKHPECKKYIKYSEKVHDKLCFQGKRKFLKNTERQKYFNAVKNFRATLFFRAWGSCSKF